MLARDPTAMMRLHHRTVIHITSPQHSSQTCIQKTTLRRSDLIIDDTDDVPVLLDSNLLELARGKRRVGLVVDGVELLQSASNRLDTKEPPAGSLDAVPSDKHVDVVVLDVLEGDRAGVAAWAGSKTCSARQTGANRVETHVLMKPIRLTSTPDRPMPLARAVVSRFSVGYTPWSGVYEKEKTAPKSW